MRKRRNLAVITSETDDFTWDNEGPYHWEDAPSYNFCLREENGNVYVRKASFGDEERKMYDFNWEEGKQVEEWHPTVGNVTHTLEGIQQTALLDGTTELALPNSPYQFETIGTIRGIGYLKGLFGDFGAADMWGGPGAFDLPLRQFDHVVKFTRGGILLYEWNPRAPEHIRIPPTPMPMAPNTPFPAFAWAATPRCREASTYRRERKGWPGGNSLSSKVIIYKRVEGLVLGVVTLNPQPSTFVSNQSCRTHRCSSQDVPSGGR